LITGQNTLVFKSGVETLFYKVRQVRKPDAASNLPFTLLALSR